MPKTLEVTVKIADARAFKEFVREVIVIRDYCLNHDETQRNYGDLERVGEQLDEALERFREDCQHSSHSTGPVI